MHRNLRTLIFEHPKIIGILLKLLNFINLSNRTSGLFNNSLNYGAVLCNKFKIIIEGTGNTISIEDFSRLFNTKIYIHGNNNHIIIGQRCYLNEVDFYIEDSGCVINLGEHTSIDGSTHFAAIEGTKISVGKDCMFSQNIYVRTGDAHSILDFNGRRVNKSKDVSIGDHCWIGMNTIIMKGSKIGNNSIIGAGTIVTGQIEVGNCIIAGIPGRIIKKNIDWCRKRIDVDYSTGNKEEIDVKN